MKTDLSALALNAGMDALKRTLGGAVAGLLAGVGNALGGGSADAGVVAGAAKNDFVVTRNALDFTSSLVPALTPTDFLALLPDPSDGPERPADS